MLGLVASLALWLAGGTWLGAAPTRFLERNFRLQVAWAKALLGLARAVYGLRIETDLASPGDTPVLVFVRHASLVDALLPTVFVSGRHGTRLRFVMKRELLLDPCLDVVGQRLPNVFVARGTGEAAREEAAIRALAQGLGPGDGIVMFPEGTRFTAAKRVRALERIAAGGDAERLAFAKGLRHVLPPRSRGPLALLEVAPHADVLLLAHHGLEGTSHAAAVLRGARVITMKGNEILENADIVIRDNRIAAIGPRGQVQVPDGARIIDVAGRFVVPGFVDTHAHLRARGVHRAENWSYAANLAYGVTTTRDPQTGTTDVLSYEDMVQAGTVLGPRIYSTGPGVMSSEGIRDQEHATRVLKRYSEYYDTKTIKQYVSGNREVRQWIINAARELKLMPTTEGSLDIEMNLTEALDGYSGHEHSWPAFPLQSDVIRLFAESQIVYTPTILVA